MTTRFGMTYLSLKCVVVSLNYNIRIQLTKRCPAFKPIQKDVFAKIHSLSVKPREVKIENTSYYLNVHRHREPYYLLFTITTGTRRITEKLKVGKTIRLDKAIDFLIQRLLGKRQENSVVRSLEPTNILIKSLSLAYHKVHYPFVNAVQNLTIDGEPNKNALVPIIVSKMCFHLFHEQYRFVLTLIRIAEREISREVHYLIKLKSEPECLRMLGELSRRYGDPTKQIYRDGSFNECINWDSVKNEELELNVYVDADHLEDEAENKWIGTVHVLVCPRGTAVLFNNEN